MNIKLRSIAISFLLMILSGCVSYPQRYPVYATPMAYPYGYGVVPYGGYGVAPMVRPMYGYGHWGYRGFRR